MHNCPSLHFFPAVDLFLMFISVFALSLLQSFVARLRMRDGVLTGLQHPGHDTATSKP